jgi:hypothetical protein
MNERYTYLIDGVSSVMCNNSPLYRLQCNGTDLIHKYTAYDATISLAFAVSADKETTTYTSCGTTTAIIYYQNASLRVTVSWPAEAPISLVTLYGTATAYDINNNKIFVCNAQSLSANASEKLLVFADGTVTTGYDGLGKISLSLTVTVTYTDGSTRIYTISGEAGTNGLRTETNSAVIEKQEY